MTTRHMDITDEILLTHIASGNRHAFTTLVDRHATRFFRVAYRIVLNNEDAEDIVQDAFVKLWQHPNMWDATKGAKFTTWFYRVITNSALNVKKSHRLLSSSHIHEETIEDTSIATDDALMIKRHRRWIEENIKQLPDNQQLALNLCFFEELSNQEAANIMGISVKAIQSLIMRAKTTLKNKVTNDSTTM